MNKIGETFGRELSAASCSDGVSWDCASGTLLFSPHTSDDGLSDDQYGARVAAAEKVLAAHDPTKLLVVVPDLITDRQCFQQLALLGKVTPDEALAAVTVGALPKAVSDGIAALPTDQQFAAKMLLCGATEFHRSHPMVPAFLGMLGLSSADGDALWTAAAKL